MTRVLAGLFDNRGDAERTIEHLVQGLHINPAAVEACGAEADAAPETRAGKQRGLRWLTRLTMPRNDYAAFEEGIRRKGVVVMVQVHEVMADKVMDVFEEYGAVDLDARMADWRGAGWAPSQGGSTGHDEDIGYSTYGGDAVIGHIPRHHHDNTPAGLLGRFEMAAMRHEPERSRARVRRYVAEPKPSASG
jgi:hypothetical protein